MGSVEGFHCVRMKEIIFLYHTASVRMMEYNYPRKVKTKL